MKRGWVSVPYHSILRCQRGFDLSPDRPHKYIFQLRFFPCQALLEGNEWMTRHGDELVFTFEELTFEPESRCLAYSYIETRQTCIYDASAEMMSLGRRVHKPK